MEHLRLVVSQRDDRFLDVKAREAIDDHRLPAREPDHLRWASGANVPCAVCDLPVTGNVTDLEADFGAVVPGFSAVCHLHAPCFSTWIRISLER
jgi:hypothetical protein